MKKIILIIFTVFLLASCAMEDASNSCTDLGATDVSTGVRSISNTSSDITCDKDCLSGSFVINFGLDWSETEAAHAAGIQGPGLKDGSFGSFWSVN